MRVQNVEDRSGRHVVTTSHLFLDTMATFYHLGIAERVAGTSSYTHKPSDGSGKYGVVLQQDDLEIVFMTIRYADKLWHPQFFSSITFVSQRFSVVFWFVQAQNKISSLLSGLRSKLWISREIMVW